MHDKPLDVVLFVVDACQLRCKYCYNKFPRSGKLADLKAFLAFAKELQQKTQRLIDDLILVGGEPTLHPKMQWLVSELLKLKVKNLVLWTNFEQDLNSYYIPLLDQGCKIAMSWHGREDDKKNLNFIKKALQLPTRYIDRGQVVELDLMVEQDNFENFKLAYKILKPKYGAFTYIWPVYTTELVIGEYTQAQLQSFQEMSNELSRNIFEISRSDGQLKMLTPAYNYLGWNCKAGEDYIYVHCDGNVYNCQSYYQFGMKPIFSINQPFDCSMLKPCACQVESCRFADYQVEREMPNANIAVKD